MTTITIILFISIILALLVLFIMIIDINTKYITEVSYLNERITNILKNDSKSIALFKEYLDVEEKITERKVELVKKQQK